MVDTAAIAADVARRYGVAVCPSVVRVCPPRMFSATLPVWDGQKLVYPDADARKAGMKKAWWAGAVAARATAINPAIAARRAEVTVLHGTGLCVRQISERLGVSYVIALKDHRLLGLQPNAYTTSAMTQSTVRAARIAQLHGEGWTCKAIAALLGVADDTVRELALKHHGLRFARRVAVLRVPKPPKAKIFSPPAPKKIATVSVADILAAAKWRTVRVADLISQGLTQRAIAALLQVSQKQISRDCRDIGIEPRRPGRWRERQAVAA